MQLDKIYIKGFRNFKEATVNLNKHCLIIGANDVGKTNLIYAMRILLDRGFSDYDYELQESDFYAYEDTDSIVIRLYFSDITEDCVVSKMGGLLSDDGNLVLQYEAKRTGNQVDYEFKGGKSDSNEDLNDCNGPFYKKWLNLKYISSRRDFWGYINKTKNLLLTQAMEERGERELASDERLRQEIERHLNEVDEKIPELTYVKNATKQINTELDKLSIHNREQHIVFDTATTDVERMIRSVNLVSKHNDKKLVIGGEGRANQIYLSLWATQNQQSEVPTEVSIICIEEPEAYLHPHQQRELAAYLGDTLNGQVILTSHSPYVVSEFSPNSIIRLYKDKDNETFVASEGCSDVIEEGIEGLGYRMSVIPAEAFFSDFVILVEGPSEVLFYKALAQQLDIDLDRMNISVMSVDGVDFVTYIKILDAMDIDWTMRTDNDIMKVPKKEEYRYAGIERGIDCWEASNEYCFKDDEEERIYNEKKSLLHFEDKDNIPTESLEAAEWMIEFLSDKCIEIADVDLETDLYDSDLRGDLRDYYYEGDPIDGASVIKKMKNHKAINMYGFLKAKKDKLVKLKEDKLAEPLTTAVYNIEEMYGTYADTE
jgi:putative ATP-dependent endonuclease of OLD family